MDRSELLPKDSLSRSIFQRGPFKKTPQQETLPLATAPVGRGKPVEVPSVPVTDLFPAFTPKQEPVDHTIQVLDSGRAPVSHSHTHSLPQAAVTALVARPRTTSDQVNHNRPLISDNRLNRQQSPDAMYQGRDRPSQDQGGSRSNYEQQPYGNRSDGEAWKDYRDSQTNGNYRNRGSSDHQGQSRDGGRPYYSRQDSSSYRQQQSTSYGRGRRPSPRRDSRENRSRYGSPESAIVQESNKRRLSSSPQPWNGRSDPIDDKRPRYRASSPRPRTPTDIDMDHISKAEISSPTKAMQRLDLKTTRPRSKSRKDKRRRAAKDSDDSSSQFSSSGSDSESEDSEQERQNLSGATPLKIHGVIHDLLLDLQKARSRHAKLSEKQRACSKKIGDISRKLERRFRDLSEATLTDNTPNTRPTLMSMSSIDKAVSRTAVVPSTKAIQQVAMPLSVAPVQRPQPPQRAQSQNGRIPIAKSNLVATLTNIHSDVRSKAFGRKPRSMIHHVPIAGQDLTDIMVTSSLDGTINFWDLETRRVVSSISKESMNQPWPEDMCWVGRNVLAVASATKEGVPMNHQLTLVDVQVRNKTGGSNISWNLQTLDQMPHDKGGIGCMAALNEDAGGINLVTAALDKQIIHWKFLPRNSENEFVPIHQKAVHSKHTSTIQSLCFEPQKNILFSGGADSRLIAYDMGRSDVVSEYKNQERGRINYITINPRDPNLILISHATTSNQLSVHDYRLKLDHPVLRFGFESADNLSRQVVPSWHPEGALVSSGMQAETKINIWDVRWVDVQRGQSQSIDLPVSKRVFKAAFHPRRSLMTSISADSCLSFTDFQLNNDQVVNR